jgi:hypothetical protein
VQEDIAKNVTSALNILLDPTQKENMFRSGTNNVYAYEEFLKGRALHNEAHAGVTMDPLKQANVHFEKAIGLDHTFAEAYFLHSDLFIHSLGVEKNSQSLSGYSDERNYNQIWADLKAATRHAKTSSKKLSYEFTENAISDNWSKIPTFIKEEFALQPGYENVLILISPEFMAKRYNRELKLDPFNPQVRATAALALISKNELDSASALFSGSTKTPGDIFMESLILLHKKDYQGGFDLLSKYDSNEDCQYILLALLAGKYQKSYRQLEHSIDSLGFDIGIFTQSPIQIYNAIGEFGKADSLAHNIDKKSFGSGTLCNNVITYGLNFHLSATPNLSARLRELGIDPVEFEKKHYYKFPVVKLKR